MRAVPEPFRPAAAATSQRILVGPAGWMRTPDPVGRLGVLQAAVFTDRRLRLRYRSSGRGEPEASRTEAERPARERVVDLYGLVCKAGVWYLVADSDGGGNVEVVSPPEVRADLASVAADVVARYGPDPAGRVV